MTELFVMALSVGSAVAYGCRFDQFKYFKQKLWYILFNWGLVCGALFAFLQAVEKHVTPLGIGLLTMSLIWLAVSYPKHAHPPKNPQNS